MKRCLYSKCGAEFEPNKPKQKFCSDIHRVYYSRENSKKVKVGDKIGKTTVTSVVHFKDHTVVSAKINDAETYNIQAQIDKLTADLATFVGDSPLVSSMRNKLRDKIDKLKKQLK
jgi:hypothetical protein